MNHLAAFKNIKGVVFDVDGVFTTSDILITEEGQLLRTMTTRDGWAVKQLVRSGIAVCVITGGKSKGVAHRLQGLGITDIHLDSNNKLSDLNNWLKTKDLDSSELLYMGDDIPDLEVIQTVGFPTCPADAAPEIQAVCKYVSPFAGGRGCVRDIAEKILKSQGNWPV